MKINQAEAAFAPVTIVLESEAEAKVLATLAGAMSSRIEQAITGEGDGRVSEALFGSLRQYHVAGARLRITSRD